MKKTHGWHAVQIVSDPTAQDTVGLIEIKSPYSGRDKTVKECCSSIKDFCSKFDGKEKFYLKKNHNYYYQVQCQMYY